ncbi:cytochrome P450 [Punctularia strigosozonata HHB-11173 SS5]|uniref:cytochrome P450 n=1 Tax=Punctularia strigosozonata (strain HHB-11173) TaxID=741275 RepID=UPI0004418113|nr:cytochrome P450 [Punctularia strigosozonata HHB-11173 SS5]EIN05330.1 cytochrome P450 [Punctularia strigosozonata HHB-11173 SS5]
MAILEILYVVGWIAVLWGASRVYDRTVRKVVQHNLPGPPRESWLKGNFGQLFNSRGWDFHYSLNEKYGSAVKVHGLFGDEQIYVMDPLALHHIVVKDQEVFQETATFTNFVVIPSIDTECSPVFRGLKIIFGEGLLATVGEQHRKQRKILNPVFSQSHMRNIGPIFQDVAFQLRDMIKLHLSNGSRQIDMLDPISRAALEIVGEAGFGYSFDALKPNVRSRYAENAKRLIPTVFKLQIVRQFLPLLTKLGPAWFRRFLIDISPVPPLKEAKRIADTLNEEAMKVYAQKRKALEIGDQAVIEEIGGGTDIFGALMRANMSASEKERLTESELFGQINTLIFAATDTTTGAISRTLFLLASHPEVQERLRQEIVEARENRDLSYDTLSSLPYLDAVCRETLRLFPPLPFVFRTAISDGVVPLMFPIRGTDGEEIREVHVRDNQNVIIGIGAINRSKALWGPDADEWRPERWLNPLPDALVHAKIPAVYSHLMTFLGGGRSCIGFKLAQFEMKIVLSVLLEAFSFQLPDDAKIFFPVSTIVAPTTEGHEKEIPHMPMKVTDLHH